MYILAEKVASLKLSRRNMNALTTNRSDWGHGFGVRRNSLQPSFFLEEAGGFHIAVLHG